MFQHLIRDIENTQANRDIVAALNESMAESESRYRLKIRYRKPIENAPDDVRRRYNSSGSLACGWAEHFSVYVVDRRNGGSFSPTEGGVVDAFVRGEAPPVSAEEHKRAVDRAWREGHDAGSRGPSATAYGEGFEDGLRKGRREADEAFANGYREGALDSQQERLSADYMEQAEAEAWCAPTDEKPASITITFRGVPIVEVK